MQWVRGPSQSNVHNPNSVSGEGSKYFREIRKEYLKFKIDEYETNSNTKNIRYLYRGINDFTKGYQPRTNIVKDEKVIYLQTTIVF